MKKEKEGKRRKIRTEIRRKSRRVPGRETETDRQETVAQTKTETSR